MAENAETRQKQHAAQFFQFLFSIFLAGYIELRSIRAGVSPPLQ